MKTTRNDTRISWIARIDFAVYVVLPLILTLAVLLNWFAN